MMSISLVLSFFISGFLLGLFCYGAFFLFDILFFFLFNLSGAFLPVRVWAVQMEDKKKYLSSFVYRVRG